MLTGQREVLKSVCVCKIVKRSCYGESLMHFYNLSSQKTGVAHTHTPFPPGLFAWCTRGLEKQFSSLTSRISVAPWAGSMSIAILFYKTPVRGRPHMSDVQFQWLLGGTGTGTGRDVTDKRTNGQTDIWTDRLFSENIILDWDYQFYDIIFSWDQM